MSHELEDRRVQAGYIVCHVIPNLRIGSRGCEHSLCFHTFDPKISTQTYANPLLSSGGCDHPLIHAFHPQTTSQTHAHTSSYSITRAGNKWEFGETAHASIEQVIEHVKKNPFLSKNTPKLKLGSPAM